jgi:carboxyl-terminal processing protease
MKKQLTNTIIIGVIIIVSLFFIAHLNSNIAETQNSNILNDLEPFIEALSIVRNEYIEKDVAINKLVEGAIKGMLLELDDPYSRYLDPISFQREQEISLWVILMD